jgi:hypothetical protein
LNADYRPEVLASWDTGVPPHDCLNAVKRKLGYRFVLVEGTYADETQAGDEFAVSIQLRNDGWAAPFNLRPVELLLRNRATGLTYKATLPDDPRFWLGDDGAVYSLSHTICTPTNMPLGDYELLLNLPDPKPLLRSRPEYAIRLANDEIWEENTGYNKLLHTIAVTASSTSPTCSGIPLERVFKVYLPAVYQSGS